MKRKHHHAYTNNTSAVDLFCAMMVLFLSIAVICMAAMKVDEKKKNIQSKTEFMITVRWDNNQDDDIDLWVSDPLGKFVSYYQKQAGFLQLDRDDLGNTATDFITLPNGEVIKFDENKEVVSIRAIIPGEYIVNCHAFNKKTTEPTKVTVLVEKLNPYKIVMVKTLSFNTSGEEKTFCRFKVDTKGEVVEINDLEFKFIGGLR